MVRVPTKNIEYDFARFGNYVYNQGWPINEQNDLSAEQVQEQWKKKLSNFVSLYTLIDIIVIRKVKKTRKCGKYIRENHHFFTIFEKRSSKFPSSGKWNSYKMINKR